MRLILVTLVLCWLPRAATADDCDLARERAVELDCSDGRAKRWRDACERNTAPERAEAGWGWDLTCMREARNCVAFQECKRSPERNRELKEQGRHMREAADARESTGGR